MSPDTEPVSAEQARVEKLVARAIKHIDIDSLRSLLRDNAEIEEIKAKLGPQNKEELWQWMKERVGVELSRVTVCEGHCSQLDMAWELYSFQVTRVLWVMSRGGGKTSLVAWIDECQAEHFPGWATFTIGANRTQGDRKYEYLLPLVVEGGVIGGKELEHVIRSIATKTELRNGSKMEIALGSSPENANGPRTPRLHRDETELMDPKTYKQAGNIPAGRKTRDGRYVPAQILDTSTMKYAEGLIDRTIQNYNEAKQNGVRPRMEVRICCIYEIARENPTCRSVPEDQRRARLIELKRDPDEICNCDTYISDVWPAEDLDTEGEDIEPEPRTLEQVCRGRFARSRGYKGFDDIQTLFLENDRETWEAEQACAQPSTEGAYIKSYSQMRNGIRGFRPDPENGVIDQGVDWGADDEHAVIWFQTLERPVEARSYLGGDQRVLQPGAVVAFAEIYKRDIGNTALGKMVIERENEWVMEFPGWRLGAGLEKPARYPDSANLGARLDWSKELGLETTIYRKDFQEELKLVRTRIGSKGGFYVVIDQCPWFDKSIRAWRQENGREVRNFATHPMAAFRYREHNVHVYERRIKASQRTDSAAERPAAAEDELDRQTERQKELARTGARGPAIELITDQHDLIEDLGIAAAEDSPLRESARSMPGVSSPRGLDHVR